MFYSDDPIADFERYSTHQEEELKKLPVCSECGKTIQDEYAYYINDEWVCEECLEKNYRKEVEVEW